MHVLHLINFVKVIPLQGHTQNRIHFLKKEILKLICLQWFYAAQWTWLSVIDLDHRSSFIGNVFIFS